MSLVPNLCRKSLQAVHGHLVIQADETKAAGVMGANRLLGLSGPLIKTQPSEGACATKNRILLILHPHGNYLVTKLLLLALMHSLQS